jgi:DNA-binding transcriptional ArsR family regulator
VDTAQRLLALFESDAERVRGIGRAAANALRVFDALRRRPLADVDRLARQTGVAYPTAARAVDALVDLGILRELTGRRRGRVFAYDRYIAILNEGAQPL